MRGGVMGEDGSGAGERRRPDLTNLDIQGTSYVIFTPESSRKTRGARKTDCVQRILTVYECRRM